jgi:hypothetical protein
VHTQNYLIIASKNLRTGIVTQVVEHLPNKYEALRSNTKNKRRDGGRKGGKEEGNYTEKF